MIVFDTLIRTMSSLSISDLSTDQLKSALDHLVTCPAATNLQLQHLLSVPPRVAWSVSNILVSSIRTFLDPRVPRHTQVQQRMSVEKVTFVKLLLTYKSSKGRVQSKFFFPDLVGGWVWKSPFSRLKKNKKYAHKMHKNA